MIRIDLGLSENYMKHWTPQEALRELFQNAIDNGAWESNISKAWEGKVNLSIVSLDATLSRDTLLLGETTKDEDPSAIGKFGEGYKLAVLVLLRNGMNVTCHTGDEIWHFYLRENDQFDIKMLSVDIEELGSIARYVENKTVFEIEGLSIDEYEEYKSKNLHLQEDYNKVTTNKCEVLLDKENRSKIFVGGLYVCPYFGTSLYGYNFNVGVFPLGRDRNIIEGFNANWEASKALVQAVTEDREMLKNVLDSQSTSDTENLYQFVSSNDVLSTAMWDRFRSEHPDSVPCEHHRLEDRIKEYPYAKFVVVTSTQFAIISRSTGYDVALESLEEREPSPDPLEYVQSFYDKNLDNLKQHFGELMLEAANWKVKD